MRTVRQLLEAKSHPPHNGAPHSIRPDAPVLDALRVMAEHGIGAVLVIDGPNLLGILSERDYARKVVLYGRTSADTPVRDIMSADVVTTTPNDTVEQCMQSMTEKRIRHLPVIEHGSVVGIVSIGDLVKAVIEDQKVELDQLQRYIAS
jgi:CBS domain-containing protein